MANSVDMFFRIVIAKIANFFIVIVLVFNSILNIGKKEKTLFLIIVPTFF